MKILSRQRPAAFSLTELLLVVAIIGILAAIILTRQPDASYQPPRIRCINNLKNIGVAFRIFAVDNDDRYPLQATTNAHIHPPGGSGGFPGAVGSSNAQPWQVFQSMWNELQYPTVLLCPSDRDRATYTYFSGLFDSPGAMTTSSLGHPDNQSPALSYTTLAIADESHPLQLLAADRNLNSATATNASITAPLPSGTRYTVSSPAAANSLFWVSGVSNKLHGLEGNLTYADGSVRQATAKTLQESLPNSGTSHGWGNLVTNGLGDSIFLLP